MIDTTEAKISVQSRDLSLREVRLEYIQKKLELANFLWLGNNIPVELQEAVYPQEDLQYVVDETLKAFERIDILVNNAGIQIEKTVADTSDEDWDYLMGVNARGVFMMCREIIKLMENQGGGSIINISSISALHADTSMALYNASKAFVNGLTRSIAVDHGQKGIRCNAICPGWIMTEMADEGFAMAENPEAAKADALLRHPAGRFGQPGDIARAAVWLASDDAEFITGQTLTVDGGLVAASPLQPTLF